MTLKMVIVLVLCAIFWNFDFHLCRCSFDDVSWRLNGLRVHVYVGYEVGRGIYGLLGWKSVDLLIMRMHS